MTQMQLLPHQLQIVGSTTPRIYTQPLRQLNAQTTYGYAVIEFAKEVLHYPLDPWQEWLVIHLGELLEDGKTPRFQKALVIVGRQNGKTELLKVLALFWMFVEKWPQILGVNSTLTYAKEALLETVELARESEELAPLIDRVLEGNNDIYALTAEGSKYRAKAANNKAGRGKSLDRIIVDEVRMQKDWNTYNAMIPAMSARPYSQAVFITNQGDETSIVLDSLRNTALEFIEQGSGDDSLGLFEWSAPVYADITDPEAWAMANPNLGHRLPVRMMRNEALLATTGPAEEANFRTERLCIKVKTLDAAVDPAKWAKSFVQGDLRDYRDRLAVALDVSADRKHATLVAASVIDEGKVRIEFLREWEGSDILAQVWNDLPNLIEKYKPKVFGWFPGGPGTSLSSMLKTRKGVKGWAPAGVRIEEITGEVTDACEGFAAEVASLQVVHNDDPLLTAQITGAEKFYVGDRWRFTRKGKGHADAAYASAGAVLLARTMPPTKQIRLVGPDDNEGEDE